MSACSSREQSDLGVHGDTPIVPKTWEANNSGIEMMILWDVYTEQPAHLCSLIRVPPQVL